MKYSDSKNCICWVVSKACAKKTFHTEKKAQKQLGVFGWNKATIHTEWMSPPAIKIARPVEFKDEERTEVYQRVDRSFEDGRSDYQTKEIVKVPSKWEVREYTPIIKDGKLRAGIGDKIVTTSFVYQKKCPDGCIEENYSFNYGKSQSWEVRVINTFIVSNGMTNK